MVRPCSGELDGQLMVYQSDIKGDVLVQLCTSEDKTGYHVRPPDGHDVVTEFKVGTHIWGVILSCKSLPVISCYFLVEHSRIMQAVEFSWRWSFLR